MPAIFWILYILSAACLLLAAFSAPSSRVSFGWLGMLLWLMVSVLRAAGVS